MERHTDYILGWQVARRLIVGKEAFHSCPSCRTMKTRTKTETNYSTLERSVFVELKFFTFERSELNENGKLTFLTVLTVLVTRDRFFTKNII